MDDDLFDALKVCVRRGLTEKAMFYALKLYDMVSVDDLWKGLCMIAVADVGDANVICAVDVLRRLFSILKEKDEKRVVVACAAKILADAPKDRRSVEFLDLLRVAEKCGDDVEVQRWVNEFKEFPSCARLDDLMRWIVEYTASYHKTSDYASWRVRFEAVMKHLIVNGRLCWNDLCG